MKQTQNQVGRIPPLTPQETVLYYSTGVLPDRFEKTDSMKRHETLRQNGVNIEFVSTGE